MEMPFGENWRKSVHLGERDGTEKKRDYARDRTSEWIWRWGSLMDRSA
jgi:hypothetical protein